MSQPIHVNAQPVRTWTLAAAPNPGERCAIVFVLTRNTCEGVYVGLDPEPPVGFEGAHLFQLDGFHPAFAQRLTEDLFFWVDLAAPPLDLRISPALRDEGRDLLTPRTW